MCVSQELVLQQSTGRNRSTVDPMTFANASAIRRALENAGVELIDEDGGGPGARLKQPLSDQDGSNFGKHR